MSSKITLYDVGGNPIDFDGEQLKHGVATATLLVDVVNSTTVNILSSFNIASAVRVATGQLAITFATPMDNDDYVAVLTGGQRTGASSSRMTLVPAYNTPQTVNDINTFAFNSNDTTFDNYILRLAVFGGKD